MNYHLFEGTCPACCSITARQLDSTLHEGLAEWTAQSTGEGHGLTAADVSSNLEMIKFFAGFVSSSHNL